MTDGFLVELEARVFFHLCQRLAAEVHQRPRDHLAVAVLAHHERIEGMMFNARLLRNGADEAGGVKERARTEDAALRQSALLCDEVRHHVAGIGDIDEEAVEAAGHDLRNGFRHLTDGIVHFIIAAARCTEGDVPHSVDDDVAVSKILVLRNLVIHAVRHEIDRIHQVLTFADDLGLFRVADLDDVCHAHHAQSICHMRAYMACAQYADRYFLICHNFSSLVLFRGDSAISNYGIILLFYQNEFKQ